MRARRPRAEARRHWPPPRRRRRRPAPRPTRWARSRSPPTATGAPRPSARSQHFKIGGEHLPARVIRAFGILKKAAALVNRDLGALPEEKAKLDRPGGRRGHRGQARRPLPARRLADRQRHADQHERQRGHLEPRDRDGLGGAMGSKKPVHPNDDVNMCQSSNDTFPTAMHIAAVERARRIGCSRRVQRLRDTLDAKAEGVRGHRQDRPHAPPGRDAADARPGVLGLGRAARLGASARPGRRCRTLYELALGGTAVGTGLNAHAGLRSERSPRRSPS